MAHIFRLYTAGGSDNIDGWADSIEYGTKAIGVSVIRRGQLVKGK